MTGLSVNRERPAGFLPEGGAMTELVREKDWSATPFGPLERWPQSLKTVTALMLESSFGLAIVRKAVERMNGKVGMDSDGVHGSRFWIELATPKS